MRRGFLGTLLWGSVFGLAMNYGGFALALALDLPTSPAIIVAGALVVFTTKIVERKNHSNSFAKNSRSES